MTERFSHCNITFMKTFLTFLFFLLTNSLLIFTPSFAGQNNVSPQNQRQMPSTEQQTQRTVSEAPPVSGSESERHHYYTEQLNSYLIKIQTSHMNIQTELKTLGELIAASPDTTQASAKLKELLKTSKIFESAFFAYAPGAGIRGVTHFMLWYMKKRNVLAKINPDYRKYNYLKKKWYLRPMRTGNLYYTDPYSDSTGENHTISAVIPIYKEGKPIGVAGADIPLRRITHNLSALRFGNKGFAFLLNGSGLLLAHPNTRYIGVKKVYQFLQPESLFNTGETDPQIYALAQVMLVQRKKDKALITDTHSGKKYIAYFGPIIGTDWAMCILIQMQ